MRRFGIGLLCALAGYVVAAFASYLLIMQFSPNVHDRSVEAAMTSVFFFGPAGAVIGLVIGIVWGGRRSTPTEPDK
jgi:hypothetical protein